MNNDHFLFFKGKLFDYPVYSFYIKVGNSKKILLIVVNTLNFLDNPYITKQLYESKQ